jgi:DnaK suppressor protein
MNQQNTFDPQLLEHFRKKLLDLRYDIIEEAKKMLRNFQEETSQRDPDNDPILEKQWITEASLITKEQEMLNLIDMALERIDNKTYGYCAETGEPISIERLEAYPMAMLSFEAQQEQEKGRKGWGSWGRKLC